MRRGAVGRRLSATVAVLSLLISGVSASGILLAASAEPAAAATSCSLATPDPNSWGMSGGWYQGAPGSFNNANNSAAGDSLQRNFTGITAGSQIAFNFIWGQGNGGAGTLDGQQSVLNVMYGGVLYARFLTPGPSAPVQNAYVTAFGGATVSPSYPDPASGMPLEGTAYPMVITLPAGVPDSGTVDFTMYVSVADGVSTTGAGDDFAVTNLQVTECGEDFGDAPSSYGTDLAGDGPRHTVVDGLNLGADVDDETDGQPNATADGDDAVGTAPNDENGVADPIVLTTGQPTTVTVSATNNTGQAATLAGWIDLDGNGTFDAGELQTIAVPATGTDDYDLTFPAGTVTADTFARFRLFPAGTDPADILPTGPATGGEVEDYPVAVSASGLPTWQCTADGLIFQSNPPGSPVSVNAIDLVIGDVDLLASGIYGNNINAVGYNVLDDYIYGVTGDTGQVVRIGADGDLEVLGVPSGAPAGTVPSFTGEVDENNHFWVADSAVWWEIDLATFAVVDSGPLQGDGMGTTWGLADWAYVPGGGNYLYTLSVNATGNQVFRFDRATKQFEAVGPVVPYLGNANAMFADADGFLYASVSVGRVYRIDVLGTMIPTLFTTGPEWSQSDGTMCAEASINLDFGDAPNSFDTTLADGGPRHRIVDGIHLGADIDRETDGRPNAAADGDDTDDLADEDGVEFNPSLGYATPTLRTGIDPNSQQPVVNTLDVTASADGFVSVWVDWNQDGDVLDAGEQVANAQQVIAGANPVTFPQGTNPAGIETYVRVRYSTDAASIGVPTGAAPDGEIEDYRVLIERLTQPDTCTPTDTDYYAFTFTQPIDATGTGGAGSTVRYANVAVAGGVPVDMFVEVVGGGMNTTQASPNGFRVGGGALATAFDPDDAVWIINTDATLKYSFYEAGTTDPVTVNGVFTINDLDGYTGQFEIGTLSAADLATYAVTQGSAVTIAQSGGNVAFHGNGNWNGDPQSRFQFAVAGVSSFEARWQGADGTGLGFDGDGDKRIDPPACEDFGDAPNSYGTDIASNGPRHTLTPGLTIGSEIDFDPNGQPTADATGDDVDRISDEDAFTTPLILNPGATSATVTVPVTNTTGAASSLYGWIDANGNGIFDSTEFASIAVPDGATSVDLAFAALSPLQDGTNPVVRLRLTSDALVDNPATPLDERALGAASNGEVEDHLAQVATPVPVSCVSPFVEDFGTRQGSGYGPALPAGQTTYVWEGNQVGQDGQILDGEYGIISALSPTVGWWWHTGADHTAGDTGGQMMVVNAHGAAGTFFQRTFTGLSVGASYDFSAWLTNANGGGSPILPNVKFRVIDPASGTVLAEGDSGNISAKPSLVWEQHGLQFVASQTTVRLEVVNNGPGGNGNDLALDDISLSPICEWGDAPAGYGTLSADDGPGHIATGPTLGTERDTESDGQPNAAADGDDTAGTPDDEDGISAPIEISVGGSSTVSVSATNDSDEDVTLAGWIDLDGSGTFDAGERVVITVPANSGTDDYDLDFPAGTVTTDTFARFRIYGEIVPDPQPTGTVAAGEVEDYPVTVLEQELEVEKTSDATEDSRPGDTVTYTVTATNTGAGDYTAANPAVVLDDLSGVLDDGAYNNDAQADRGAAPSFVSPIVSWTGELPAGESVVITYTVTLGTGGDGVVRNVAFGPGCDPADPDCDTTTPECDPPVDGVDPVTGIPCAETETLLPRLVPAKTADTTELPADGGVVTYTVTLTNAGPGVFTAAEPGTMTDDVSAVLDDATYNGDLSTDIGTVTFDQANETFDWSGPLGVGEVATITYSVTYDSSTGNNQLLNVACVPVELAQDPASPCRTVAIPGSSLQDRKTVDPASGTAVVAGQDVTYTLSFENTGLTDATVDTVDDLSNVLDDATLTAGPTTSDPALSAALNNGTQLDIDGIVPAGQTYTVTYTVTVNAYADQGDHNLGNVLGEDCAELDPSCRTENPIPHLDVDKTSDAQSDVNTGDTVTYTVTVTNDGEGDYTAQSPAVVFDDLTGVLDDATYNGDAQSATGTLSYTAPTITWTGALASGDSETFTYTVTVTNAGDHSMENIAGPVCADPEICDPGVEVITPLPYVVPGKSSVPASGSDVNEGDVVTYTLSWTNSGEAAGVVDATDDLSDVLDDGDVTSEPVSSDPAVTAVRNGDEIRITGPIQPDQTITVTYQVTIKPDGERGNNVSKNVLTPDEVVCTDDVTCPPTTTEQFVGELVGSKTVNPASGTSVVAGQQVTYTLTFSNIGEAPKVLDTFDDLSGVLDDATLVPSPTTSDPALTAVVNGTQLDIDGTVPEGATYTVTYTVTVNAYAQQGDHTLRNVLGEDCAEDDESCRTENPIPHLTVTKTSDATEDTRVGDTVTYTVTGTNDGTGDFTTVNPAVVLDDLSGVLDDGVYNNDADATVGNDPIFASPLLSWVGELATTESVSFTYTVTLGTGGDGVVRNVAFTSECDPGDTNCDPVTPECDPPVDGVDPVTGIPCAETETLLPRLVPSKTADTTELPADGGVVTYTVTVTNAGPGVFTAAEPGTLSDDLSAVLDDATYNGDVSTDIGTVTFDQADETFEWSGPLGVGEVATIRYSVTYDSSTGDNSLVNVACVPVELAQDPNDPCRSVVIPGANLQDRKSVDPASGTSVVAGQDVTYTLYFENTGQTDATVDTFDDLSNVLDDATLTGGPTTSDPALTAVVNGTQLDIDGTVPAGETFTVTYTVTVSAFAQQGDHNLGNVLGECPEDDPTCSTENPVRHIDVDKTSDAAPDVNTGDTVTYTVTVTNDGEGDYTDAEPAVAFDDLTGVLDDATYNDDAQSATGTVSYSAPRITWTGALAAGDSITFTYTVTVTNAGDHVMENIAGPVCVDPEICDPGVEVITPLPHVIPGKASEPASGAELLAGDVVTYTLSWTNDGEAAGPVDATDDLVDILDDGDVTSEPVSSDPAVTAVRNGDEIRITGMIQPDQTVTVTYQVTIKADGDRGNNIARNVLTPDVLVCTDEAVCPPTTTEHGIGELDDWKTVDPASGSTVQPGQEVTYTLHFENVGEADVPVNKDDVLTQVLDDATMTTLPVSSDPALTVSALNGDRFTVTGTLTPGQLVTVTYTLTINPDGQRGDDRLGNFLVPNGEEPPEECVPEDPDRPDCTVTHVSEVVPSKSANPASGTEVTQGQQVTYTLTFENVSANPDAADATIDYTDHMADVLDDATLTSGPVSSDPGVAAVVEGDTIRITGPIASGDTVTVSYTVTVKTYDQQANHHLGNVIAITGEIPICAPDSTLCTNHELPSPPPLAHTGGTIAGGVVLGALALLLAGGGALLLSRRRRTAGATAADMDTSDMP